MRIYVHYEEEEPNHTAALSCNDADTKFVDLLQQFVDIYNERFGDENILEADSLELKNSKKKKMKNDMLVAGNLSDKEDLFVYKTAAKASSQKPKVTPKPKQTIPIQASHFTAPPPISSSHASAAQTAQTARRAAGPEDEECLADRDLMATVEERIASLPANDRFKFAQERIAVECDEDGEMDTSSPVPTQDHNVQANCLKCQQHIFYKSAASLISCCHCSFLLAAVECTHCGTFFPTVHDKTPLACPVCRQVEPLLTFKTRQKTSFSKIPEQGSKLRQPNEIHLIVQFYTDKSEIRQEEIDRCLRENMANKNIRHVHVLTEKPMNLNHFQRGDKLVQYVQGNWLRYCDAIIYAQRFLSGKVVIIANADIFMDDTLSNVRTMDLTNRCLALTRHDIVSEKQKTFNGGAAPISQDVWIFRAPLPEAIMSSCDFCFGKPGCDNRFAYELRMVGLRVTNPCFKVVANHLHASDLRNYVHGPDTVHGAYAAVIPIHSLT